MKWLIFLNIAILIFKDCNCLPSTEQFNFFEEAKLKNFNDDELEILKPITDVFQFQYNKLAASINHSSTQSDNENNDQKTLMHLNDLLSTIQPELPFEDESYVNNNLSLPITSFHYRYSVGRGLPYDEAHDIRDIYEENRVQAYQAITNIIEHSKKTKTSLISIDIVKIVKFIYKMMEKIYALGTRAGRTAYCTYSNVPAINSTLQEGNTEIGGCYNYTETSVGKLRKDVKTAITDIEANLNKLVSIYKKLANRHSLLGKLLTLGLNVQKIVKDITETRSKAIETLDELKADGPVIAANIKQCASTSIPSFVQKLNETLTDLVTCVTFVDESTQGPEPEPESEEDDQ